MQEIETHGLKWLVGDQHSDDLMAPSDHEHVLDSTFRELLGNGVLLDIGAHSGHWTVRMAQQASKVIAVEANPDTADLLRKNVALNGFTNVTVLPVAAWDRPVLLRFEDPKGERVRSGTLRTVEAGPDDPGAVMGVPLDFLLDGEPEITLVKMDVEGADLHVLRGLRLTLERLRPKMLIERHDFYGYYTADELFGLLDEFGYGHRDAPLWFGEAHLICEPR